MQPYDVSLVGPVEKSIRASDLGLNPSNDGRVIRIPIPPLTEERRKTLAKHVHKVLEDHRTAVRNVRRDVNDHLKKMLKDKAISEDEEKRSLDEIQPVFPISGAESAGGGVTGLLAHAARRRPETTQGTKDENRMDTRRNSGDRVLSTERGERGREAPVRTESPTVLSHL